MPSVIVLLLTCSLLPSRAIRWTSWFGRLTDTLVAPVSHPLTKVSRWLWPAGARFDDREMQQMYEERERLAELYAREQAENGRLREYIKELQRGLELNPGLPVRQLTASVYRNPADLTSRELLIRAGEREGVTVGTVVTCSGLQLLGRVTDVGPATCKVQPITSKAAGRILAQVMLTDANAAGLACTLDPVGDGTLRGPVAQPSGSPAVTPGMTVRLNDPDRWPASSQFVLIGQIETVEPDPAQPLRTVITVRPSVLLDRVGEVYLRLEGPIPGEGAGSRSGGRS